MSPSIFTWSATASGRTRPAASRTYVSQSSENVTAGPSDGLPSTVPRPSASTRTVRMNSSGPLTSKTTAVYGGAPASFATTFGRPWVIRSRATYAPAESRLPGLPQGTAQILLVHPDVERPQPELEFECDLRAARHDVPHLGIGLTLLVPQLPGAADDRVLQLAGHLGAGVVPPDVDLHLHVPAGSSTTW